MVPKYWLIKIYRLLFLKEYPHKPRKITKDEKKLIEEFIEELKPIEVSLRKKRGKKNAWEKNTEIFINLCKTKEVKDFLQWNLIRDIMFVGNGKYLYQEFENLKKDKNYNNHWRRGLIESKIGNPTGFPAFKKSSGNIIHQAHHLLKLKQFSKTAAKDIDFVFEFGGGYGNMCKLMYKLGFNGTYIVYDLPCFSALQKYYLKASGHKILNTKEYKKGKKGIICVSNYQELTKIIKSTTPRKNNLFIALWSISECPIVFRKKIMSILNNFNLYLIAFQDKFENADNLRYFNKFSKNKERYVWRLTKITNPSHNYYLLGKKNNSNKYK